MTPQLCRIVIENMTFPRTLQGWQKFVHCLLHLTKSTLHCQSNFKMHSNKNPKTHNFNQSLLLLSSTIASWWGAELQKATEWSVLFFSVGADSWTMHARSYLHKPAMCYQYCIIRAVLSALCYQHCAISTVVIAQHCTDRKILTIQYYGILS